MTHRALYCVAMFVALLACRQPQTTQVIYNAADQTLTATPTPTPTPTTKAPTAQKAEESQKAKITKTDGQVQVYMGIGDTIAASITNLPPNSHVTFSRADLPREQVQMPTSWPLSTGKTAAPEATNEKAPVDPKALITAAKHAAPPVEDPDKLAAPPVEDPAKQNDSVHHRQDGAKSSQNEKKPSLLAMQTAKPEVGKVASKKRALPGANQPDPTVSLRKRLIGSMMREAFALSERPDGVTALKRLKEAEAQIQELPMDDTTRPRLQRSVIAYQADLLAGDTEENLVHHDDAAKALNKAAKALADGKKQEAAIALAEASTAVEKFSKKAFSRESLLIWIADYQKRLVPATTDVKAILPPFTYSGQDFDVRIEVVPDGATELADDKAGRAAIARGFYIQGRRDRDWMLFSSTGLALSHLVDDEYGIRETATSKSLVKLSSDKARGEFLVFLNFQNRGITAQAFPILFGLGVGSTGSDIRYYLGPGVSLGSWGALHVGWVGGKVQRLRETVNTSDYKGTDPSAERRSVFRTDYFLSITARF